MTAKEFRAWGGSMTAAMALRDVGAFALESQAKRNVLRAIDAAAARLGNTRTVACQSYVHPAIVKAHLDGALQPAMALTVRH